MTHSNGMEFEVLGFKVRYTSGSGKDIDARSVVEVVNEMGTQIKSSAPSLSHSQVAILVALKMAEERLRQKFGYQDRLEHIEQSARGALELIEEAMPDA
jgi:cell division protein ZapA (FtsZ GTPase activity inhibitor)